MNRRISPKSVSRFVGNSISTNKAVNATKSIRKNRRAGNGLESYVSKITDDAMPQRVFKDTSTGASFKGAKDWDSMRRNKSIDDIVSDIDYKYKARDESRQITKDKEHAEKLKRMKTIAGLGIASAYAGNDAMNRYRGGGTVTRNNKGERDVVGIPFL